MKTSNSKTKAFALGKTGATALITAATLTLALMFTACPNSAGGSGGASALGPKVKVTLKKNVGGNVKVEPALPEDSMVAGNTELTFKAQPLAGYKFTKWVIDDGTKTVTEPEYKHKVQGAVKIKAVFAVENAGAITKYNVTLTPPAYGTVTSDPDIPSDNRLPEDTEITFTAQPHADYGVGTWTVMPSDALKAGGTAGSTTATVKVEANTTVKVTFRHGETYIVGGVRFRMKDIAAVTNGTIGHSDYSNPPYGGKNPEHTVSLSAYRIGETQVTQELWQAVMGNNPSFFDNTGNKMDGHNTYDTSPASGEEQEKRPVENVSWYHAIAFCNKLSIACNLDPCYTVSGVNFNTLSFSAIPTSDNTTWNNAVCDWSKNGFRLPTEAEWEWAAQGGTARQKWAGTNEESELVNYAWYSANSGNKTHQVKIKQPNAFGLYDMSGNVYEWCWDWYSESTPAGGQTNPTGPVSGSFRVIRGGSWRSSARYTACAYRGNDIKHRGEDDTFRVVCRP